MQNDKSEQFLSLFAKNQKRIYGFITVLVPQAVDADDLMQETMLVMWRRFDDFQHGTDFAAWGISIARRIVMKFYSERKNKALLFDDETMQTILQHAEKTNIHQTDYNAALQHCMDKLNPQDRKVIRLRYEHEMSTRMLALQLGRTLENTYKILARIHALLQRCVQKTLIAWETHP